MRAATKVVMAAVALCVGAPAFGQAQTSNFSAGVTGGTLGIGPEIGYRAGEKFGMRGNATFFSFSRDAESDGVDYDGDLKLQSFGAVADYYPMGGGFRISAGARVSDNRVKLAATPTSNVEIGDTTYTPAQVGILTGRIEANKIAPTLTVGYGGGASTGFKFGVDAGVMLQGSPKVEELRATGTLANDAGFRASLEREAREIEDDIDNFKVYPILQLSLGYAF